MTSMFSKESLDLSPMLGTYIGGEVLKKGIFCYEPPTMAMILSLIEHHNKNVHFVDIGANVFLYPTIVETIFGEKPKITAFEPLPSLVSVGKQLKILNSLHFDIVNKAVGCENKEAVFYVSAKSDSSNSLKKGFRKPKNVIKVEVQTIDTFFNDSYDLPVVMKIDTETTEPDVISGAQKTILTQRPWIICEVLKGYTEQKISELFSGLEYSFYLLSEDTNSTWTKKDCLEGDSVYHYRDWLFAPCDIDDNLKKLYEKWLHKIDNLNDSYKVY